MSEKELLKTPSIDEIISDDKLLIEKINNEPQTYCSLLNVCNEFRGTQQVKLRRRISSLLKYGDVCKTTIPGTQFGKCLFYTPNKKYYILIEADRVGSNTFYFKQYKKISKYYISVDEVWQLLNDKWKNIGEKIFFEGKILRFY